MSAVFNPLSPHHFLVQSYVTVTPWTETFILSPGALNKSVLFNLISSPFAPLLNQQHKLLCLCSQSGSSGLTPHQLCSLFAESSLIFGLGFCSIIWHWTSLGIVILLSFISFCWQSLSLCYTLLLTFAPSHHYHPGWTHLPCSCVCGWIKCRHSSCVCCFQSLSQSKFLLCCAFTLSGLYLPNVSFLHPCGNSHHEPCIQVGAPLTAMLSKGAGLCFPKVHHWVTFIEICTVWSVVNHELHCVPNISLMMLECTHLIDMTNAWATDTHTPTPAKTCCNTPVWDRPQLCFLSIPPWTRPPSSTDIPLMWTQLSYILHQSSCNPNNPAHITLPTAHVLRSETSQFLGWEMIVCLPLPAFINKQENILNHSCEATGCYYFTLLPNVPLEGFEVNQSLLLLCFTITFALCICSSKCISSSHLSWCPTPLVPCQISKWTLLVSLVLFQWSLHPYFKWHWCGQTFR